MVKHVYIALALLILVLGGFLWRVSVLVAQGQAAQDQLRKDVQAQIVDLKGQNKQIDQQVSTKKSEIKRVAKAIESPKDVIASLPLIHSPFAGTVEVQPPLSDSPWKITSEHPIYKGPSSLVVTDPKKFFDAAADCQGSKEELEGCGLKLNNLQKEADLQKQRAESAEQKIRGSWGRRLAECGLRIGLGAGVGGAFGSSRGAIAGGAAGLGTCFIKF